jgi:tRNA G18 (ribose-2'-O)-methylase SpoU
VTIERRRSLLPVLKKIKQQGEFKLIGLEQTTNSQLICDYVFPAQSVLVIGHERDGIDTATLALLNAVVEIPIFGKPDSYNVATATSMALYEFTRQGLRR